MKYGDLYNHYKGVEYFFNCIALPMKDSSIRKSDLAKMEHTYNARYHEDTHDIKIYSSGGATFIDSDVPHVIYQSEKHYGTDYVYAREVDDFFGYKADENNHFVKRFSLSSRANS